MGRVTRRVGITVAALVTAVAGSVGLNSVPAGATGTLWSQIGTCINSVPSGYHVGASYVSGDLVKVLAPTSLAARADALAVQLRTRTVAGKYASRLGISTLGAPGQPKPFLLVLDPYLEASDPGVAGIEARLCSASPWEAALIDPSVTPTSDALYAAAAHELFHAAQSAVDGNQDSTWLIEATAEWAASTFGYTTPQTYIPEVTSHPNRPIDSYDSSGEGSSSHQYGAWAFIHWLIQRGHLGWSGLRSLFMQTNHVVDHTALLRTEVGGVTFDNDVASFWGDRVRIHPEGEGPPGAVTALPVGTGTTTRTVAAAPQYAAKLISLKPPTTTGIMQVHIHTLGSGMQAYVNQGHDALAHVAGGDDYTETFCFGGAAKGTIGIPKGATVRVALATTNAAQASPVQIDTVVSPQQCPQSTVIVPGVAVGPLHIGMTRAQAKAAAQEFTYKAHPSKLCPTCIWAGYKTTGQRVIGAIYSANRISTLYVIGQVGFITTAGITPTWYLSVTQSNVAFPEPMGSSLGELKHGAAVACSAVDTDKHPALNCRQQQPLGRYTTYQMGWVSCLKTEQDLCTNPDDLPIGPEPGYYVLNIIVSKYKQWGIYG